MEAPRSNIKAGILTLAALAAFSGCIWAMNAWKQSSMVRYTVQFSREQGVYGIKEGTSIVVGGIPHGKVVGIVPTEKGYDVAVRVDAEVPIYRAARIGASAAGVNGEAVIEVQDTGRRPQMRGANPHPSEAGLLLAGSSIVAVDAPPYRTFVGGSGATPLNSLVQTWFPDDQTDSLWSKLSAVAAELPAQTSSLRTDAAALTDHARTDLRVWKADFEAMRRDGESAFAKLGAGTGAAAAAIVPQMREMADEIANMKRPDTERVQIAFDAFEQAIASARSLGAKVGSLQAMLKEPDTSVGRASADFSIASQELSATEREAVLEPWRLAGGPAASQRGERDRAELVRAYAMAATQFERAMKGIEDSLRRDEKLLATDPALAELLRSRFEAANAMFDAWRLPMEDLILGTPASGTGHAAPKTP